MRLTTIAIALSLSLIACAKKPAPQSPKSNAPAATEAPTAEPAAATPAPGAGAAAPKNGKTGDPCDGGQ